MEAGGGPRASCLSYHLLTRVRLARGDWAGAEQAGRRWVALQPELPSSWCSTATTLAYTTRYEEALAAMRRCVTLSGNDATTLDQLARMLIMARKVDEADSLVRAWNGGSNLALRRTALDLRVMIDRERGQLRESVRNTDRAIAADSTMDFLDLVRANSLSRLGDYGAAERLHERRIHGSPPRPVTPWPLRPGTARAFCWEHALLADAIAPSGDTLRVRAIADSLEQGCKRSYYSRDWTLHHHLRGLIHAAAGRHALAAREFRQTPTFVAEWWPRTTVELAKAEMAQGRPREALAALQMAYATPVDAMGRYVPRSELDYYKALVFSTAGMRDSAAVYVAFVRRAWKDADPEVKRLLGALRL
jgi:tetratricopeptide (TPR) repeat protein